MRLSYLGTFKNFYPLKAQKNVSHYKRKCKYSSVTCLFLRGDEGCARYADGGRTVTKTNLLTPAVPGLNHPLIQRVLTQLRNSPTSSHPVLSPFLSPTSLTVIIALTLPPPSVREINQNDCFPKLMNVKGARGGEGGGKN